MFFGNHRDEDVDENAIELSNLYPEATPSQLEHLGIPIAEEKPKALPPPATAVRFPAYDFLPASPPEDEPSLGFAELQQLFKIRRLQELSPAHLCALKVRCGTEAALEGLVPAAFLPPPFHYDKNGHAHAIAQGAQQSPLPQGALSNGRPRPSRQDVELRMRELGIDNDDAYDSLARRPLRPGRRPVKIAHFRRFWSTVQHVGGYWDTSQDDEAHGWTGADTAAETARRPTVTGGTSSPQHDYTGHRISTGSAMPQHLRADVAVAFLEPWAQLFGCCVERTRPGAGGPARVHIGRLRTAVEHAAVVHRVPRNPGRARAGFNEGPVMLVQCRAPTTLAPLLTPRAATSTVVKAAADAAPEVVTEPEVPLAADAGMATETAPATTTTPPPHASPPSAAAPFSERSSAFDLLRELAAMLSTAQQRAREGATEVVPGRDEHAAWAHEPRFPGTDGEARGTPLVHDHDEAAILGRAGDVAAATDDPPRPRGGDDKEPEPKRRSLGRGSVEGPRPSGPSLEQRAAIRRGLIRRSRQPPRETWEPNVEYRRVGMEAGADADTIYMLVCMNHHLALVRMRVPLAYVAFLADPTSSATAHAPQSASVVPTEGLRVTRSRWWDLFVAEDRMEAARAVCGALGWLMRETEEPGQGGARGAGEELRRVESDDTLSE